MELRWGDVGFAIFFIATNPSSTRSSGRFGINFGGQCGLGFRLASAVRVSAV
jgi:hypothetical protein